jgi:hypothetical protein
MTVDVGHTEICNDELKGIRALMRFDEDIDAFLTAIGRGDGVTFPLEDVLQ